MKKAIRQRILKPARRGLVRPRDLREVPRVHLRRLVQEGVLWQPERGLYLAASAEIPAHQSLAEVAARAPKAVVGLLSALRFHELTTENPSVVYILLPPGTRPPRMQNLSIDASWVSGESYEAGVEEYDISGVTVRITSPAKTVVDCFKFRSKIGVPVAVEALRDAWRRKKATADELWRYSRICRMQNVMRPYFESTIG